MSCSGGSHSIRAPPGGVSHAPGGAVGSWGTLPTALRESGVLPPPSSGEGLGYPGLPGHPRRGAHPLPQYTGGGKQGLTPPCAIPASWL